MNKEQAISCLCSLASEVNEKVYGWGVASDCLCENTVDEDFRFDEEVIRFIESAVRIAIDKDQDSKGEL